MTESGNRTTNLLVLLALCVVGILLYSRTLHVPWVFDDIQNICENPVVHDFATALRNVWGQRGFAYLTFAVNYRFGGLDVVGYHLVNIAIHLLASWLVYLLAKRAFPELPAGDGEDREIASRVSPLAPVFVAFLFLVHPIQTQAVNYIVQRMTSLSALLFLLAVYGYVRFVEGRESQSVRSKTLDARRESDIEEGAASGVSRLAFSGFCWYAVSLVSSVLALMTKQNAAVLPAALLLFDWLVLNRGRFPNRIGRRLASLIPFVLVSLAFIYVQVGLNDVLLNDAQRAEYWARADEASATSAAGGAVAPLGRGELPQVGKLTKPPENLQLVYLVTEFKVLWLYLRLLFLPYDQTFDYGYPLEMKMLTVQNALAGAGLLMLFALACYLARRKPLVSFGIFWFFTALAVESSIIPLDAAVEHRLYLPMFGFAVAFVSLFDLLVPKRWFPAVLAVVVLLYAGAGWQRNAVWGNNIAFALDGVRKAPHNQRTYLTLATAYADEGRWAEAEAVLRKAIPLRPSLHIPYDNLGTTLFQQGRLAEARAYFSFASLLVPDYPNAIYNYGIASLRLGDMQGAIRSLDRLRQLRSPLAFRLGAELTGNR